MDLFFRQLFAGLVSHLGSRVGSVTPPGKDPCGVNLPGPLQFHRELHLVFVSRMPLCQALRRVGRCRRLALLEFVEQGKYDQTVGFLFVDLSGLHWHLRNVPRRCLKLLRSIYVLVCRRIKSDVGEFWRKEHTIVSSSRVLSLDGLARGFKVGRGIGQRIRHDCGVESKAGT